MLFLIDSFLTYGTSSFDKVREIVRARGIWGIPHNFFVCKIYFGCIHEILIKKVRYDQHKMYCQNFLHLSKFISRVVKFGYKHIC